MEEDQEGKNDESNSLVKGPLLLLAAKKGRESEVEELLATGAPVEYQDENNWTPLLWAACNGHVQIVKRLLENNAGASYAKILDERRVKLAAVNPSAQQGLNSPKRRRKVTKSSNPHLVVNSPLHWASYKGHEQIVWLLLKFGFAATDVDDCGNTSLHLASTGGHASVLQTLLSSEGGNLDIKNHFGNTPLSLATNPATRAVLIHAGKQQGCMSCSTAFSFNNSRYLCTCCNDCFCSNCSLKEFTLVKIGETIQKPSRYCRVCLDKIKSSESQLRNECDLANESPSSENRLDPLKRAIEEARRVNGDAALIAAGEIIYKKLVASCALNQVLKELSAKRPISLRDAVGPLVAAVDQARLIEVKEEILGEAQAMIAAAYSECKLNDAINGCEGILVAGPSNLNQIKRLSDSLAAAEAANATPALVDIGKALKTRLEAELELIQLLDFGSKQEQDDAPVVSAYKDGEEGILRNMDGLPASTRLEVLQLVNIRIERGLEEAKSGAANVELIERTEQLKKILTKKQKVEEAAARERRRAEEEEAQKREKKTKAKK